jgi:hypothetical protein
MVATDINTLASKLLGRLKQLLNGDFSGSGSAASVASMTAANTKCATNFMRLTRTR